MTASRRVVALAVLANMVCYLDRAAISTLGPDIRRELELTSGQMGLVFGIFSLSYFLGQAPWGALADRYGARWLVAAAIAGWSVFTSLTGVAWSLASLVAIRFVFGGLEAALSPAVASAFRVWIPEERRSTAFGFFLSGGRLGGFWAPGVATALMLTIGWRNVFHVLGALGIGLTVIWVWGYRDPARAATEKGTVKAAFPWALLQTRRMTALLAVAFGLTFLWQFFITWFPTYLMEQRGMQVKETAAYAALPFLFGLLANSAGGAATDAWGRRAGTATARRWIGTLSLGAGTALFSSSLWCEDARLAAVLMSMAAIGTDLMLAAAWASALDIGGENGGATAGLMNAASNLAGFASPLLAGLLLERLGGWTVFLAAALVFNGASAVLWLAVNPKSKTIPAQDDLSTARSQ
ncbi:MAG: MFS transporter [Acidobacteria bacterium]|nr:MFS transporter [Acidobacteriota bacterium]